MKAFGNKLSRSQVLPSLIGLASSSSPRSRASSDDLRISGPSGYKNLSITGVFGIPLPTLMKDYPDWQVSPFVEKMCLHIEEMCLDIEGIFRLPGTADKVEKYRNLVNNGKELNFFEICDISEHDLCALLKLYLRELPDPLLCSELYDCFLAKAKLAQTLKSQPDLKGMIKLLPRYNRCLLKRVVSCLRKVKEHSHNNKMNATNLGTVFGPSLLRSPSDRDLNAEIMENFAYINSIALSLIENYDDLFSEVDYKPRYICYARASFDYQPEDNATQLALKAGDHILVMEMDEGGWWLGELNSVVGYFPASFCTFVNGQPCEGPLNNS
jgi:hypothetical protein